MELEWKASVRIPDGKHQGSITKVVFRSEPYEYIDVFIKPNESDLELKYGCPATLSEKSKLGRLMIAFGEQFEEGKKIDPEKILVGKVVEFITLTKKNKDGREYIEIVEDSLKPITFQNEQ